MQTKIYLNKKIMIQYFQKNNISLHRLLNSVFNNRIKKITYLGNCVMRKMPEYEFNLLKFNIVLKDCSNYSVFIRIIDINKIEESLFCYWFFCEEYFSINIRIGFPKANIINVKNRRYEKRYQMQLLNRNNKIWQNSFVDIIDLKKYVEINLKLSNDIDKLLFIAIL